MAAILQYTNQGKEKNQRVWKVSEERKFTALIKCFVQGKGEKTPRIIEKPSKRPATFTECYRFAEKLKKEYGHDLKQLIVWDIDRINENSPW